MSKLKRQLLLAKWDFTEEELKTYHETIIERFSNTEIVDEISRVARTPMRKLGYDERFIRPIRELSERVYLIKAIWQLWGKYLPTKTTMIKL